MQSHGKAPVLLPHQHKEVDLSQLPAAARREGCSCGLRSLSAVLCGSRRGRASSSISNEGVRSKLSQEAESHGFSPYHIICSHP